MATRKGSTKSKLRTIKEHEELERRLYEVLISGRVSRSTNVFDELWAYADEMMGYCPDEENFYDDDCFDE